MNNSVSEKPVLLVIDDSKSFLQLLVTRELCEDFTLRTIRYQLGYGLDKIIDKIRKYQPDHLLLDVNLVASGNSHTLLREATKQGAVPEECKIWIITQEPGGLTENILDGFQEINVNVQELLLVKPISIPTVRAALLDESWFMPSSPLDESFPLPLRVLSPAGKVVFTNAAWQGNELLPLPDDFPTWLDAREIPEPKKYVGSFPGTPGKIHSGYRIVSFRLEQDGQQFLGQMAVTCPLPPQTETLDETLQIIFKTMRTAGFSRGRYYQLTPLAKHTIQDDYDTLMELLMVSPQPKDLVLPLRFPLTGELKKRFGTVRVETIRGKLGKTLLYKIREYKDEKETQDEQIIRLNELLQINAENTPSWLEIPIYILDYDRLSSDEKPGYRIAGLLIFDAYDQDMQSRTIIDREISKERVQSMEHLLLSLIFFLNHTLKKDQEQKLRDYEYSMRGMDRRLAKEKDIDKRYGYILDALMKHCRSDSALLVIKKENYLCHAECKGRVPSCLRKVRFPVASDHYLVTSSFNQKQEKVVQDYSAEEFHTKIHNAITEENELELTESGQKDFLQWLDQIRSAVALPVTVDGGRPIGSIALQYTKRWAVSVRRMNSAYAIVHRVRWVMQDAMYQEAQQSWEKIIGHDLRSSLLTLEQYGTRFAEKYPDIVETCPTWRELRFYLQDAIDQAENLHKIWTTDMEQTFEDLRPGGIIRDYLELATGYREEFNIQCRIIPGWQDAAWQVPLRLNPEVFARIIRNLLQNSFKYGRKYVDRTKGESAPVIVRIQVEHKGSQWRILITNPGHMEKDEYEVRFEDRPNLQKRQDGMHVGLSSVKFWADKMDCGLSLENEGRDQVQAILTCGISKGEKHG